METSTPPAAARGGLLATGALILGILGLSMSPVAARAGGEVLRQLIPVQASTVPANGDQNPYGVAFVPEGFPQEAGTLIQPGNILVSNFNDATNTQATGSTIVKVAPDGEQSLFFQGASPLGLTTALAALRSGFVLAGSAPLDSTGTTVTQGSLLVVNGQGQLVTSFADAFLDGPWDLTVDDRDEDRPRVFVSNVLSGKVVRLDLRVGSGGHTLGIVRETVVASGYAVGLNDAALVVGPTGLAYDARLDILYVASTLDNEIFAVPDAEHVNDPSPGFDPGPGTVIFANSPDPQSGSPLRGPLGLAFAPNGHLVTTNGDAVNNDGSVPLNDSNVIEFTVGGKLVARFSIDSAVGAAFGLAFGPQRDSFVRLATADDAKNALTIYSLRTE